MKRRDFIAASLALIVLPQIGKADEKLILYGNGVHDDTKVVQALFDGKDVYYADGQKVGDFIEGKFFRCGEKLFGRKNVKLHFQGCQFILNEGAENLFAGQSTFKGCSFYGAASFQLTHQVSFSTFIP